MHNPKLRAPVNALAKIGLGAAIGICLTHPFDAWIAALALLCIVIDNLSAPLPEDKLERELMLERELETAKQQAVLDRLTIDRLQVNLNGAMEANRAYEAQSQAWASQGELQAAILTAAKQRIS